jgi:hypothetical protein
MLKKVSFDLKCKLLIRQGSNLMDTQIKKEKRKKMVELLRQVQEEVKSQAAERQKPLPPNADALVREHFQRLVKKKEMELITPEVERGQT